MNSRPLRFDFHRVGVRGAVLVAVVFGVVATTRLWGISSPTGMYFDEILWAPAGAAYAAGEEPREWTHPPLAKRLMAVGIRTWSGFGSEPIADAAPLLQPTRPSASVMVNHLIWAIDGNRRVVATLPDGSVAATIQLQGDPTAIVAPVVDDLIPHPNPFFVAITHQSGDRLTIVDVHRRVLRGDVELPASIVAAPPGTGLVWVAGGRTASVVEPFSGTVLHRFRLPGAARALIADPQHRRVVAKTSAGNVALYGVPQRGWRAGSALAGATVAAIAGALAIRCFGSPAAGLFASALVAVDGLSFVTSRYAGNMPYVTAFVVAAWFCAASSVRARSQPRTFTSWLVTCSICAGLAVATHWAGVPALVGVTFLFLYSMRPQRRFALAIVGVMVFVPAVIYLASYFPYHLWHDPIEFIDFQIRMASFHATDRPGHWYSSGWYAWPLGLGSMLLYVGSTAGRRTEVWMLANPVVFLGGLAAVGVAARSAARTRSTACAITPLAALVQMLPVAMSSGTTYLYHYLPVVPFLAVAVAGMSARHRARFIGPTVVVAGAAVFVALLPLLDAWVVPPVWTSAVKALAPWLFANPLP